MADDYTLASLPRLLKLVNDENPGAELTEHNVTLGLPTTQTLHGKNTVIDMTGIIGRGRSGTRPYYYDRLNLGTFFQTYLHTPPGPLLVTINNPINSYDLLPRIRQLYSIGIDQNDIVNEVLTGTNHTLKAKPTSLAWVGTVQLNIQPLLTELSTFLTTLILPLFTPTIFDIDPAAQLLAQINLTNGTSFTFNEVEFTGMIPAAGQNLTYPEVIIQVKGKASAMLTGTVNIRYTRTASADIYQNPLPTTYPYTPVTVTSELIDLLAVSDSVTLTTQEVNRTTIGVDPDIEKLTANQTSLLWTYGSNFFFDAPKVPLDQSQLDLNWEGLYPSDVAGIYYDQVQTIRDLIAVNTTIIADGLSVHIGDSADVLPTDDFILDVSTLAPSVGTGNTSATFAATQTNTRYTGSAVVNFNRVDAADVFIDPVDFSALGPFTELTARELLNEINLLANTGINTLWIEDTVVTETDTVISLTFTEGQFVFIPGTSLSIQILRPGVVEESGFLLIDTGAFFLLDGGGYLKLDDTPTEPIDDSLLLIDGGGNLLLDGGGYLNLDNEGLPVDDPLLLGGGIFINDGDPVLIG